jgi:hypothetical protein
MINRGSPVDDILQYAEEGLRRILCWWIGKLVSLFNFADFDTPGGDENLSSGEAFAGSVPSLLDQQAGISGSFSGPEQTDSHRK